MDSVDVMNEVDVITSEQVEEQVKAEKEANLVPEGTWEGLVVSWNKVEESEKGENNTFKGVSQYKVGVKLFDCPEPGKSKMGWFSMTPSRILGEKGKPKLAYQTLVQLVKQLHMEGQPIPDVLEQAKVTRLKYRVRQFETAEGSTINFLQAVTAACLMLVVLTGCEATFTRTCQPSEPGYQQCVSTLVEPAVACEGSCRVAQK